MNEAIERPAFREALQFWFKLGWISFGGTAGHIALMHDFLVDKKKWISNSRFFHALSLCMLLPGPEAQQLAIYIGWQLHGKKGGLIAGTLFVLPSMFILLGLSIVYVSFGNLPWIYALFSGLKPAVIAIIIIALVKVGRKSLHHLLHYGVAAAAFVCIFFFNISLLTILIGTIVLAVVIRYISPGRLQGEKEKQGAAGEDEEDYYINSLNIAQESVVRDRGFRIRGLVRQLGIALFFWLIPFVSLYFFSSDFGFWRRLILFFTQAAFFTIGGSYTVLPYVAQFAIDRFGWLSRMQMLDGFALAETTPGPLIIVVGFVGFMAGFNRFPGSLLMGAIALVVTTFYTFLPCFLFIFVGGPLIGRSHGNEMIGGILSLVAAAIVGVILNLTLFLGRGVFFPGRVSLSGLDYTALVWVIVAVFLLVKVRLNVVYLILVSLLFGFIRYKY